VDDERSKIELDGILGEKPNWMIRWGISLLLLLVLTGLVIWRTCLGIGLK
jgi:hypothetical protein